MCQQNNPVLKEIDIFYGASHIVRPFIEKLGFDIFDIENPFRRIRLRREGYNFVRHIAGGNLQWQRTKRNFRDPREAFISRAKLVELYGNPNFGS